MHSSLADAGKGVTLAASASAPGAARNLGFDLDGMTTVDLDMVRQYRPQVNVLERIRCQAIAVTGHHELMLPLIHATVVGRL